jgi:hypothetical protein
MAMKASWTLRFNTFVRDPPASLAFLNNSTPLLPNLLSGQTRAAGDEPIPRQKEPIAQSLVSRFRRLF